MNQDGLNIELDEIKAKLDVALNKAAEKWGKVLNLSNIDIACVSKLVQIKIEFKSFVNKLPALQTGYFYSRLMLIDFLVDVNWDYGLYAEQLIIRAWFSNCRSPEEFVHNATLHAIVVNKTSIKLKA